MDITAVPEAELERYVTRIMLDMGVPAHLKGYHYLREAIMISGRDMAVVSSVTKLLYHNSKTFSYHGSEGGAGNPQCHRGIVAAGKYRYV